MRGIKLLLASGALAIAVMLVPAGAAQARSCTTQGHPSDPSWVTVCNDWTIAVCDAQPDGHKVYARVWGQRSKNYYLTSYDDYGYDANGRFCYHEQHLGLPIALFATCVQYEGCSAWRTPGY
jgi:hypothetical protein